jgi:CheY-like chemotaxis protein
MTGHANPIAEDQLEAVGIDRILPKPFKLEQLKSALFD